MSTEEKEGREALKELRKEFENMRDWGWGEGRWKREDKRHNDPAYGRTAEVFICQLDRIKRAFDKLSKSC